MYKGSVSQPQGYSVDVPEQVDEEGCGVALYALEEQCGVVPSLLHPGDARCDLVLPVDRFLHPHELIGGDLLLLLLEEIEMPAETRRAPSGTGRKSLLPVVPVARAVDRRTRRLDPS